MPRFRKGSRVAWQWATGEGSGKIVERFTARVSRELKGKTVTRNATRDEPAYLIIQEDGDEVLKSASELRRA